MAEKKIEDFGEKIEGARKDIAALRQGTLELTRSLIDGWDSKEQEQYITKDLVWKRPNYQGMVDNGLSKEIAYYIKLVRDAIPSKPPVKTEEGMKGYVEFVQYVKNSVLEVKSFSDMESFKRDLTDTFLERSSLYSYKAKPESYGCFQNKLLRAINKTMGNLTHDVRTKEFCYSEDEHLKKAHIQAIFSPSQYDSLSFHSEKRMQGSPNEYGYLDIYARTKTFSGGSTSIIRIQDKNRKCPDLTEKDFEADKFYVISHDNELLYSGIASKEEAERLALEYARKTEQEKNPEKKKTPRSHKEKLLPPQLKFIKREGVDHRENNVDVSGDDILETFKLRGGQFGNWTNQNDRQTNMNMLFDAFRDLAVALNISYEDISLSKDNGSRTASLAIAWGARGHAGALAHYEPVENVINLTKMRGAGSLAHEWGHALDCYIKEKCGYTPDFDAKKAQRFMATHCMDRNNLFDDVIDAMRYKTVEGKSKPVHTDYYKESENADKEYSKTDNGYWRSACEMFARAFACYVSDKLEEKGIRSDYLAGHANSTVYPKGEERRTINKAIDNLIENLKELGFLKHQIHDIQAEAKKQPSVELHVFNSCESVQLYENGEQLSFFDMMDSRMEQLDAPVKEDTSAADMPLPSAQNLPNWKVEYVLKDAPDVVNLYNTKTAWEVTPWSSGEKPGCEELGIRDLCRFRDKAMNGTILQYKVIEGDCSDFMKPWTADELGTELEKNTGEADICRCTIYNDTEQKITCTVKVQDMGDELLQIMTNIVKSDKDENGIWQKTYDKNYYCESEELKNISIEDFALLSYRDYGEFINDAVYFAESGKEQLYSPPRNAGNYKVFNDKKATEYLYKETYIRNVR